MAPCCDSCFIAVAIASFVKRAGLSLITAALALYARAYAVF